MQKSNPQTTENDEYGELNTNEPPDIEAVEEFMKKFPANSTVRAYEGEGGSWIIVEKKK